MPQAIQLTDIVHVNHAIVDDRLDAGRKVNDAVCQGLFEVFLVGTEGWLDLPESAFEVAHVDLAGKVPLVSVPANFGMEG